MQLAVAAVVTGQVVSAQPRWTDDGARIVTEATVQAADGSLVHVTELGGELDGVGQLTMPGPALLRTGMMVSLDVHDAMTLAGAHVNVVDDAHVMALAGGEPFVREGPTPAGSYLFWGSGCIFMSEDSAGTAELDGDTEFPIVATAMSTWNNAIAGCGYQKLMDGGKVSGHEVGKDSTNLIKFRDDKWCIPAMGGDPELCHPAAAAGITTITFLKDPNKSDDGQIIDADVEINGVDFAISTGGQSLGTATCKADLGNTITHELGHVLGLEHTCTTPSDPSRTDGSGNPVPMCTATSDPTITEATMYPFQSCGETKKTTLSADDVTGACAIYPKAKDPGTCAPYQGPSGCCAAGGAPAPGSLALGGLVFIALRRRRRTRG